MRFCRIARGDQRLGILFNIPLRYHSKRPSPSFYPRNILALQGGGGTLIIMVSDDRSYGPGYTTKPFSKQEQDSDGNELSVMEPHHSEDNSWYPRISDKLRPRPYLARILDLWNWKNIVTRPEGWGMTLNDPSRGSPLSQNQFASTAFSSHIRKKVVDFTRTTSRPPLTVGESPTCFVLLYPISFIFLALLSCSHPPSSVSDPGSHRKLSSLICRRSLYSKAIEGCNCIWVLRR